MRVSARHGVRDPVLPVSCGRRIVPMLHHAGLDVTYDEFEGGHVVPPDVAARAADWFLEGK